VHLERVYVHDSKRERKRKREKERESVRASAYAQFTERTVH